MKGLGAALLQDGQPVAFASKSLDLTQSNYPNIDREMLAIVFGINRFHTYLYGRPFKIISDHKPLEMILHKPLLKAPPRLQRMLQKVQGYDFTVEYRAGKTMTLADTLSRLPSTTDKTAIDLDLRVDGLDISEDEINFCEFDFISFTPKKLFHLRESTKSDPVLNGLMEIITLRWPDTIKMVPMDIRPYWSFRDELAIEDGIIFKGQEVIIPKCMRADVLSQLHQSHQGIEKTRLLARQCAYWPNINKDIDELVRSCTTCQELANANMKEPLIPHEVPTLPWKKLATDLFEIDGRNFLLICDYFSKYPLVAEMKTTSSAAVAEKIEETMSLFGRPDIIFSDNGPQYQGKAFKLFIEEWGIEHVTSSPRYPQSNGFIERQVQTVKKIIKKCIQDGKNFHHALLDLRATPVDSKLPSPAEMLFGKPIATLLPSRMTPRPEDRKHRQQLEDRKLVMKEQYDKTAGRPLPLLYEGQNVRVLDKQNKTWFPAEIVGRAPEPRSYNLTTDQGNTIRRNKRDIRGDHRKEEKQAECQPDFILADQTESSILLAEYNTAGDATTEAFEPEIMQSPATQQKSPAESQHSAKKPSINPTHSKDDPVARRSRCGRPIVLPERFRDT